MSGPCTCNHAQLDVREPNNCPVHHKGKDYQMRQFDTGATRDTDEGKPDYEGFLSPLVLKRYAEYMNRNRVQADGKTRYSDNWQKGIPRPAYMKSAWRHFMEWWTLHRNGECGIREALCALMFNCMGYLHELEVERLALGLPDVDTAIYDEHADLKTLKSEEPL